jgi:uncharacterized hydrophobic protein (TIGR00271 family)
VKRDLFRLFSLRRDQQDADLIDASVREGAQVQGTNLWVLFFAILIASVGLNVNSTAVIIGAMLISPLMGPIVGVGYGAAVNDFALIRSAAKVLAIFTGLSLVTSALYFAVSPLDVPQAELLARTSPTLWDVLIAAFGGAAGAVAQTRRSFNNIVPGVAIATALMPPLCTTGFGLAHGRWDMVAGAFYLFTINGVFIAAATLAMSKLMRLPKRGSVDSAVQARHRALIAVGLTVVLVPSVWLGWRFVQHELFSNAAQVVARQLKAEPGSPVVAFEIDAEQRRLRLTLVGAAEDAHLQPRAIELLARAGVADGEVTLHRAGPANDALLRARREDLDRALVAQLRNAETRVAALEQALAARALPAPAAFSAADATRLGDEIRAQHPEVSLATVALGRRSGAAAGSAGSDALLIVLEVSRALKPADRERLERWLAVRVGTMPFVVTERVQPMRPSARK